MTNTLVVINIYFAAIVLSFCELLPAIAGGLPADKVKKYQFDNKDCFQLDCRVKEWQTTPSQTGIWLVKEYLKDFFLCG
jgi:hypothetical protein